MNDVSQQTAVVVRTEIVKTKKEWRKMEGHYIQLEDFEGDGVRQQYLSGKHSLLDDDGAIYIEASIYQFHKSMQLEIKTSWPTNKIHRDETIREMIVEKPLAVVGDIQRIFESVLKLKKFDYDVNDV